MKKTLFLLSSLFCISLVAYAADPYAKAVRKNLKIEHVFSRPTTAYGPGSLVMYEKKSGYTGVCLPEWIIAGEKAKISPIADVGILKTATFDFKIDLNAVDRAKIGAGYQDISSVTINLTNGHQEEIFTDLKKAFNEIGKGICGGNSEELKIANPRCKFYFIRVAYAYDLDIKFKDKNGITISADLPKEILKVVEAKIGFNIGSLLEQSISGKGLYIGFNGTPRKITTGIITKGTFDLMTIKDPVVDVTGLIK